MLFDFFGARLFFDLRGGYALADCCFLILDLFREAIYFRNPRIAAGRPGEHLPKEFFFYLRNFAIEFLLPLSAADFELTLGLVRIIDQLPVVLAFLFNSALPADRFYFISIAFFSLDLFLHLCRNRVRHCPQLRLVQLTRQEEFGLHTPTVFELWRRAWGLFDMFTNWHRVAFKHRAGERGELDQSLGVPSGKVGATLDCFCFFFFCLLRSVEHLAAEVP